MKRYYGYITYNSQFTGIERGKYICVIVTVLCSQLGSRHGMCPRLKMVSRGFTFEGNLNRGARLRTIRYRGQLPVTRLYIASLIDPPCTSISISFPLISPLSLSSIAFISPLCSPADRVLCVSSRREHGKSDVIQRSRRRDPANLPFPPLAQYPHSSLIPVLPS